VKLALKVSTQNDADFVDIIPLYLRILEQVQLNAHRLSRSYSKYPEAQWFLVASRFITYQKSQYKKYTAIAINADYRKKDR
jgi:hypothetical protein